MAKRSDIPLETKWRVDEFINSLPWQAKSKGMAMELPTFSEEKELATIEREINDEFNKGYEFNKEWMRNPVTIGRSGGNFGIPESSPISVSLADHKGKAAAVLSGNQLAVDPNMAETQYGMGAHESAHLTGYDEAIGPYIGKKYGVWNYRPDLVHEVWPRIQQARYLLNLKPGQEVTDEHIQELKEKTKNSKTFGLFNFYGEKRVKEMLNDPNIAMDFTQQLDNLNYG